MKILQVSCDGLGNGGVQAVIMNICRGIPEAQFDIILFTNETRYYEEEFEMLGGKIFRIPKYEGVDTFKQKRDFYIRFLRIFIKTYLIIKKNGPYDAIHCHNDLESGICNLAAFFSSISIRISHAHTADNKFSKKNIVGYIYKKFLQNLMNLCSNIKIGCTQKALDSIFGTKSLTKSESIVMSNPINTSRFKKVRLNTQISNINIVHVGRYCENKNQMLLIEMLPFMLDKYPDAKLQLIGSGEEYKSQLISRVISLNVASSVEFLPSDSDVKEYLNNASLFLFPSISEGFGIAALEAQAMEVPCLVSDTVPKEVDCGLCKFLSVNEKAEVWATEAIDVIRNNHNLLLDREKLKSLDIVNYSKKIKLIYERGLHG